MPKFRQKPVEIEAMRYDGTNGNAIINWADGAVSYERNWVGYDVRPLIVRTPEGRIMGRQGDWIIKGVVGDFYRCQSHIFDVTYEAVD